MDWKAQLTSSIEAAVESSMYAIVGETAEETARRQKRLLRIQRVEDMVRRDPVYAEKLARRHAAFRDSISAAEKLSRATTTSTAAPTSSTTASTSGIVPERCCYDLEPAAAASTPTSSWSDLHAPAASDTSKRATSIQTAAEADSISTADVPAVAERHDEVAVSNAATDSHRVEPAALASDSSSKDVVEESARKLMLDDARDQVLAKHLPKVPMPIVDAFPEPVEALPIPMLPSCLVSAIEPLMLTSCSIECSDDDTTGETLASAPRACPSALKLLGDAAPPAATVLGYADGEQVTVLQLSDASLKHFPASWSFFVSEIGMPATADSIQVTALFLPSDDVFPTTIRPATAISIVQLVLYDVLPLPWPSFLDCHHIGDEILLMPCSLFTCFPRKDCHKHPWPPPQMIFLMGSCSELISVEVPLSYSECVHLQLCHPHDGAKLSGILFPFTEGAEMDENFLIYFIHGSSEPMHWKVAWTLRYDYAIVVQTDRLPWSPPGYDTSGDDKSWFSCVSRELQQPWSPPCRARFSTSLLDAQLKYDMHVELVELIPWPSLQLHLSVAQIECFCDTPVCTSCSNRMVLKRDGYWWLMLWRTTEDRIIFLRLHDGLQTLFLFIESKLSCKLEQLTIVTFAAMLYKIEHAANLHRLFSIGNLMLLAIAPENSEMVTYLHSRGPPATDESDCVPPGNLVVTTASTYPSFSITSLGMVAIISPGFDDGQGSKMLHVVCVAWPLVFECSPSDHKSGQPIIRTTVRCEGYLEKRNAISPQISARTMQAFLLANWSQSCHTVFQLSSMNHALLVEVNEVRYSVLTPWHVIWALLCFFSCFQQAEVKGRKNATAPTGSCVHCLDQAYYFHQVCADQDYYIDVFLDQDHIGCDRYLDIFLEQINVSCSINLVKVCLDYGSHRDLTEVLTHQAPWDPGGSTWHRLEVKPNFKEGGMLATSFPYCHRGLDRSCASTGPGLGGNHRSLQLHILVVQRRTTRLGTDGFGLHSYCLLFSFLL